MGKIYDSELRDAKAAKVTVTSTSSSLATLLGEALITNTSAVTLMNVSGNDVYYQCDGNAADTSSALLPDGTTHTAYGNKTILDAIRLYAASNSSVSVIQHKPY